MLLQIFSALLWIPAFWGFGLALAKLSPILFGEAKQRPVNLDLGEIGLWGILLVGVIVTTAHCFIALSSPVSVFILVSGWALAGTNRAALGKNLSKWGGAALAVLIVGHAFAAASEYLHFDVGFYQLPTVKWNQLHPLAIGIVNLQSWLAYNSVWFLIEAAIGLPGAQDTMPFALNPILFTFFYFSLFTQLSALPKGKRFTSPSAWVSVGLFFLSTYLMGLIGQVNPSPAARLYAIYAYLLLLRYWESGKKDFALLFRGLLFSIFSVTLKVFTVPTALFLAAYVAYAILRDGKAKPLWARRVPILFTTLFLLVWFNRGILLSGCFLFPAGISCFHSLPWAVSPDKIHLLSHKLQSLNGGLWQLLMTDGPTFTGLRKQLANLWNVHWMRKLAYLALFGGLLVVTSFGRKRKMGDDTRIAFVGFLFNAAALTFAFLLASIPPFGVQYQLGFALTLIALGMILWGGVRWPKGEAALALVLVAIALDSYTAVKTRYGDMAWGIAPLIPVAQAPLFKLEDGSALRVSSRDSLCWAAPPPCTDPHQFNEKLQVRKDGSHYVMTFPKPGDDVTVLFRENALAP